MEPERILITVRTYPNLSTKYRETVCTGGINDRGEWRRLYPVPFRHLDDDKQYRTYDVVTVKLGDNPDGRPESRRPDAATLKVIDHIKSWPARREWIIPTAVGSMNELRQTDRTLAPVRVRDVVEFIAEPDSADWSPKQLAILQQHQLFDGKRPLEKLPFDFRLQWRDGDGAEHDSKFLAWEVGETWRQWRHKYPGAIAKMRDKWMTDVFGQARDLWFFMGNFAGHRQHFGVCGVFNPPKETNKSDTLW